MNAYLFPLNIIVLKKYMYCYYPLCWGLTTHQPLWVILCRLSEKGRREIEETVEEMKERDRRERKMNESEETEEIKTSPLYPNHLYHYHYYTTTSL